MQEAGMLPVRAPGKFENQGPGGTLDLNIRMRH